VQRGASASCIVTWFQCLPTTLIVNHITATCTQRCQNDDKFSSSSLVTSFSNSGKFVCRKRFV